MHGKSFLVLVLSACATIGCGSSMRMVRSTPRGGEIALSGPVVTSTRDAHVAMADHCGGRVRVLSETEATTLGVIEAVDAKPEGTSDAGGEGRMFFACARAVD